jgi:hypothetical protein
MVVIMRRSGSHEARIARQILVSALTVIALALIVELIIPASAPIIAVGAAVCGIATWIVPPVVWLALSWRQSRSWRRLPPARRSPRSLVAVGLIIFVFIVAVYLSAVGMSLAVIALVFARGKSWAWLALAEIAAYWVSVGVFLRRRRAHRRAGPLQAQPHPQAQAWLCVDRSGQARKRPT